MTKFSNFMSLVFLISCILFFIPNISYDINGNINLFLIIIMLTSGLIFIFCEFYSKFTDYFPNFHFDKIIAGSIGVVILYFGRVGGISDVNSLFRIDAGALPMTTIAASIMYLFHMFLWVSIPIMTVSFLGLLYSIIKFPVSLFNYPVGKWLILFSTTLFITIIALAAFDDAGRKQRIYRIAHATDISSKFSCRDIDMEQNAVLFIGPEQKKVMVVPKIKEDPTLGNQGKEASFFREIKIPDKFTITECIP